MALGSFFRDKHGKLAIWQTPNLPIIIWAGFMLASKTVSGQAHTLLSVISTAALVIWAGLEIAAGTSYFRRLLGLAVLAITMLSRVT